MLAFPLTFPANFLLILLARVWKKQVHKSPDRDSTHHSWTSCNINCNIILACLKCWKTTIMMRPYVCTDNVVNFFVCLLYFYFALMLSLSVFLSSCCSLQNGLLCLPPPLKWMWLNVLTPALAPIFLSLSLCLFIYLWLRSFFCFLWYTLKCIHDFWSLWLCFFLLASVFSLHLTNCFCDFVSVYCCFFFFIFLLVWYFRKLCLFLYLFLSFFSFESICCIGGGLHLCIPISFVFLSSCNHANSCMEFVRHLGGTLMDKGNWRELMFSILLSTMNCSPHLLDYINLLKCLVSFLFTQGCHSISSNSLYKY